MTSKPATRLSDRDRRIIDDVLRHRIMTNEILHKRHFAEQNRNAVSKVTARLCRARMLCKYPLIHPRTYLTLGSEAAQQLGVSLNRTSPLGPQSLPTEYAALSYATLSSPSHRRLTSTELEQLCPWMVAPLREFPYCLDESTDPSVLELIRVDLGGKADHVARKCDADILMRQPIQEFNEWILKGRCRLVVITGTTEKAAAVRDALQQHVWPDGLRIHLAVVPELLQLTARISDGT